MTQELKKVTIDNVKTVHEGKFISMKEATYTREGCQPAVWEYKKVKNDSVHIIVYVKDTKSFLFVQQVRIPLLEREIIEDGITIECCAGVIDKYEDADDIMSRILKVAKDEIREELGFNVIDENIKYLSPIVTVEGSIKHTCFATVESTDCIGQSLGETEDIRVIEVKLENLYKLTKVKNVDLITYAMINMILLDLLADREVEDIETSRK